MKDTFIKVGGADYKTADYTAPTERTFRAAWEQTSDSIIGVNMEKAKEMWRDKIREAREPELAKLDVEFMKALENGTDTSDIVARKNVLRNADKLADIEAATTPEELKAVQPIPNVTVE